MLSIFCLLYNYLEISTPVLPTMILNEFFFIFADLTSLENHSNTDSHLNSNVDGKCERKNERENMRQTKTIDTFDILNVYER